MTSACFVSDRSRSPADGVWADVARIEDRLVAASGICLQSSMTAARSSAGPAEWIANRSSGLSLMGASCWCRTGGSCSAISMVGS